MSFLFLRRSSFLPSSVSTSTPTPSLAEVSLILECTGCPKKNVRGDVQKKNSIFKDIVQIGGGEVNPCQKFEKKWIFDKSWRGRGLQNILSKIEALYFAWFITLSIPLYPRSTLFCMINYSVCTPDPQKVIGIIYNVDFEA